MSEHKYSFVKEADDHFVVSHPSEGSFKVAKKGISKALQKKIKGLPQSLAEGGEVDDEDIQSSGSPDYPTDADKVYGGVDAYGDPLPPTERQIEAAKAPKKTLFGDIANPNIDPSQYAAPADTSPAGNPNIKGAAFTPVFPEEPNRIVEAPHAPQQQNQPAQIPNYMGQMGQDIGQIKGGIQAQANAESDAQRQIAKAVADNAKIQQQQFDNYKQASDAVMQDHQNLTNDLANSKIDPKRMWNNMGTANKISAAIGMFLGGIGAAQTGGPNQALGLIQKGIEQDIEAQKADLGKKETLLSMNLRKYGDLNTAYQATQLQQSAAVSAKLQQISATTNSQVVQARAQQALGQLSLQQNQNMSGLSQNMFWRSVATGQTPITPDQINAIPDPKLKEQAVVTPDNKVVFASDPESAKKAKEATQAYNELRSAVSESKQFQADHGRIGWDMNANNEAQRLQTKLQVAWAKINGVGRETPPEEKEKLFKDVPNIGAWRQGNVTNALDELNTSGAQKLGSYYSAYLPGDKGSKVRTLERQAKVK